MQKQLLTVTWLAKAIVIPVPFSRCATPRGYRHRPLALALAPQPLEEASTVEDSQVLSAPCRSAPVVEARSPALASSSLQAL